MAGCVKEDDAAAAALDLAGTDALRDPATLALRHGRGADAVEQARLAVVDVAHDGHDRRTLDELFRLILIVDRDLRGRGCLRLGFGLAGLAGPDLRDLVSQLLGDERRRVAVDGLIDRGEDAAADELADDVGGVDADELGKLLHRDRMGISTAPRVVGSATLTAVSVPSVHLRGFLGPRRPRVPLRLRAMVASQHHLRSPAAGRHRARDHGTLLQSFLQSFGQRHVQRPLQS